MTDRPGWYSVRCVFRWTEDEGMPYEERITLWRARSLDEALARSEREAAHYAAENDVTYLGLAQAYFAGDDPDLTDGSELFSLLRDSPLPPATYLTTFFDTGTEHSHHLT
jgi:hypothetical protein